MKMNVSLNRINSDLRFESSNELGNSTLIDGGKQPQGMRPMELLLSALASCSAFDLELILRKQRQHVEHLRIEVEGIRPDMGAPKPFEHIHMHFELTGILDEQKVKRAVALSVEKYCSVGATLRPQTQVAYSYAIVAPAAP